MNLTDYPTPRTTAARGWENRLGSFDCDPHGDYVEAYVSEQLEREAAAWRDVATRLVDYQRVHQHVAGCELCKVIRAFDHLLAETNKNNEH